MPARVWPAVPWALCPGSDRQSVRCYPRHARKPDRLGRRAEAWRGWGADFHQVKPPLKREEHALEERGRGSQLLLSFTPPVPTAQEDGAQYVYGPLLQEPLSWAELGCAELSCAWRQPAGLLQAGVEGHCQGPTRTLGGHCGCLKAYPGLANSHYNAAKWK